jgi:5'-methylthioadenosine phosphorylase
MLLRFSAVVSLALEVEPGTSARRQQYVGWTKGSRERSLFGAGVAANVSAARPVSTALVGAVQAPANLSTGPTYACVEGPRLGTQAVSHLLR